MFCLRKTAMVRVVSAFFLGIALVSCASMDQQYGDQAWYQKTKEAETKAADTTKTATTKAAQTSSTVAALAYQRMQKYLAEKDLLQTFHDAGEHSESAVLAVLHKSATGGHAAPPGKPAPTAPGTVTQPSAPTAPEQYTGTYRWPLDAGIISSEYGERWGKIHKGLDIAADVGEPVYAVAGGDVIYAGDGLRGYGNVVILRHDQRFTSVYAHNSELKVKQGDQVKQGTLIALLGSTGHSTGPHVHFEIRDGDSAVNPRTLLPKGKFAYAVCEGAACAADPPAMLAAIVAGGTDAGSRQETAGIAR